MPFLALRPAATDAAPAPVPAHRRGRLLAAAAALGLLLAAGAAAAPASAHDELVSSTPAADAALDPAPTEIALTYSDNILEVGIEVVVTDAAGTDHVDGAPVVDGATVTVPLDADMPGGSYTADWRVVSSDGHPISGSIPFTVTTPVETTTPSASAPPVATPTDSVTSAPSEASSEGPSDEPIEAGMTGADIALIAGIVIAAVVVIAVILVLLARRRNRSGDANRSDIDR